MGCSSVARRVIGVIWGVRVGLRRTPSTGYVKPFPKLRGNARLPEGKPEWVTVGLNQKKRSVRTS